MAKALLAHRWVFEAAQALLDRIDSITTVEFAVAGDREEREALRNALSALAGQVSA